MAGADSDLIDASKALLAALDQLVKGALAARGFRPQSQLALHHVSEGHALTGGQSDGGVGDRVQLDWGRGQGLQQPPRAASGRRR
jgi:hypothetical protein